jgi:hypothetical protein
MAKILLDGIRIKVGEGDDAGFIIFNEPTSSQWNRYENSKTKFGKKLKNTKNNQAEAGACLFDETVAGVENLEDQKGTKLTMENIKDLLPNRLKAKYVFVAFDEDDQDLEKNF